MPSDLSRLACGTPTIVSPIGEILSHISDVIDTYVDELEELSDESDRRVTLFGPYIGRSLLELCLTAIIARIDPFRVLVLRQVQRQPDYDVGIRRATSIQWQGDILCKETPPKLLWDANLGFDRITRALLADYYDHLFWRKALTDVIDQTDDALGGAWMTSLRETEPQAFLPRMRSSASRLYSSLSKGVHHEFVVPPAAQYDRVTVANLISQSLQLVSCASLVANQIPHIPFSVTSAEAVALLENIQEMELP